MPGTPSHQMLVVGGTGHYGREVALAIAVSAMAPGPVRQSRAIQSVHQYLAQYNR